MDMQNYFYTLVDQMQNMLPKKHLFTCYLSSEDSEFVRFNQAKIRQAGSVKQNVMQLDLIYDQKHTLSSIGLSGSLEIDIEKLRILLEHEAKKLIQIPEDPYLLYATDVHSSEEIKLNRLPSAPETVQDIIKQVDNFDFVGIYASGAIHRGFANSLGQKNWLSNFSFNLDFSIYLYGDKAVKASYAGLEWNAENFAKKICEVKEKLDVLQRPARTIKPGQYRTYLTPTAFYDILSLLSWGGFSEKMLRTKQSPLLRLQDGAESLHSSFRLSENSKEGIGPMFQTGGFMKPENVSLIKSGKLDQCLVSPRTAKEYSIAANGANAVEAPESLDVAAGQINRSEILKELDTGLYVNNLWYLNYSDKPGCRITGMTRFATFWVENGQIISPLNVMRFDDSLYHMLGKHLLGLTKERDFIIDSSTYEERSTTSAHLPGVLIDNFNLTL
jgi:predicted Zn-dependent protease